MTTDLEKYWIKPGIYVRERVSGQVMFVDHINRKRHKTLIDARTNKLKVRTMGVVCSWMDAMGQMRQSEFHTRQLMPYDRVD